MVNVEPFDDKGDPCRRWNIAGYGLFYEKDLMDGLKMYFEEIEGEKNISQHIQTWFIRSETELNTKYIVTLKNSIFSCTCPAFTFKSKQCKHIRKVKMNIAGEKQKNKLPGVIT